MTVDDDERQADDPHDAGDDAHELRSFGRRRGRRLSPRQTRLMTDLLARVRLDPAIAEERGAAACFDTPAPAVDVWLEIGFGGGEHLVWQAERNPGVGIIGCEPFEEGLVKVLTAIEERQLRNIRLWPDDAREVLRRLPDASIARAFVLFPDPWPKKRHQKRRLLNARTLAMLARVLRPGGELRVGTDIPDYLRTIFMELAAVPVLAWRAKGPSDWRQRPPDWPETRYEQKARREGRACAYLVFERRAVQG